MTKKTNNTDNSKKAALDPVFSAPEQPPVPGDAPHADKDSYIAEPLRLSGPDASAAAADDTGKKPAEETASVKKRSAGTGKNVLVAEDEPLIRLDIVEMLQEAGYTVIGQADNGEKAVEMAEELYPDLVVMDVKMPVLDGISAAEKIIEKRIAPVVMLTAFSQKDLVERAGEAGAMAYIVKPFSPGDLIPAIEIAFARHEEILSLEEEVDTLQERFETRKLVDRAKSALTTKMGLSEPDAFRWIQKTSMDRRLSMREVAETVINQVK